MCIFKNGNDSTTGRVIIVEAEPIDEEVREIIENLKPIKDLKKKPYIIRALEFIKNIGGNTGIAPKTFARDFLKCYQGNKSFLKAGRYLGKLRSLGYIDEFYTITEQGLKRIANEN